MSVSPTEGDLKLQIRRARVRRAEAQARKDEIYLAKEERAEAYSLAVIARQGEFQLVGAINENFVDGVRNSVLNYVSQFPKSPIRVVISSPGGGVWPGWHLFDTLRQVSARGTHVTTEASGVCASMAGLILQAGDLRLMGAESYLMLHEVSSGAIGKAWEIADEAKLMERLNRQSAEIYARRAKDLTVEKLLKMFERRDLWLNAKEALEYGFIDRIVGV